MIVRMATVADAQAIAAMNEAFNGVATAPAVMAQRMAAASPVERIYLAEIGGDAVGFSVLWVFPVACFAEPYAEVSELYVHEDYRRRGIGRALLTHVIRVAQAAGARELRLVTGFRNTAAQRLYSSLGFENLALQLFLPLDARQNG